MCPAHKDKVEIKCMGSIGGKHQQNQNFIYSFLTLATLNMIRLMLFAFFNYNMGGKIRRLSMNVAFKYIWQKGLNFLTYGTIRDKVCSFLAHLVKTMRSRKWC